MGCLTIVAGYPARTTWLSAIAVNRPFPTFYGQGLTDFNLISVAPIGARSPLSPQFCRRAGWIDAITFCQFGAHVYCTGED
jgi:hypothetical protein